jgi:hypothetical protein
MFPLDSLQFNPLDNQRINPLASRSTSLLSNLQHNHLFSRLRCLLFWVLLLILTSIYATTSIITTVYPLYLRDGHLNNQQTNQPHARPVSLPISQPFNRLFSLLLSQRGSRSVVPQGSHLDSHRISH